MYVAVFELVYSSSVCLSLSSIRFTTIFVHTIQRKCAHTPGAFSVAHFPSFLRIQASNDRACPAAQKGRISRDFRVPADLLHHMTNLTHFAAWHKEATSPYYSNIATKYYTFARKKLNPLSSATISIISTINTIQFNAIEPITIAGKDFIGSSATLSMAFRPKAIVSQALTQSHKSKKNAAFPHCSTEFFYITMFSVYKYQEVEQKSRIAWICANWRSDYRPNGHPSHINQGV